MSYLSELTEANVDSLVRNAYKFIPRFRDVPREALNPLLKDLKEGKDVDNKRIIQVLEELENNCIFAYNVSMVLTIAWWWHTKEEDMKRVLYDLFNVETFLSKFFEKEEADNVVDVNFGGEV